MSVVTGALGSLAPKLLQLLHGEYKLQKGVKKQVQWLHRELESIRPFLNKVSDVPWYELDEQIKVWAHEVRETSYNMEDVLDDFLLRVDGGDPTDPNKLKGAMRKVGKIFSKAKARHSISRAIEDMKQHLEEIAQRRQKYKFDETIMSKPVRATSTIDPHLTAMCKELTQLIGVDNSRDEVISMLNQYQPSDDAPRKKMPKKVSIVGVGGLGKTTLARVVYDNLKSYYDCAAFISVGRDLELVKVFKDILYNLHKEKYKNIHSTALGEKHLIGEVQEFLKNKRYFIVIDDVWNVPTWDAIKLSLVENNCGSIVITTTRMYDVANESDNVYKLKPLSDDDSMKLFNTRIFGAEEKYHDNEQDDVINKILKKCGGIPLAIMTMASLLASKQKYQWSEVLNSISFGSKDKREAEVTMTILSYSYYDLPPDLRTCLLYLSTYPEDYEIKKDSLIWKWIAEGFIVQKQGTTLFELGERHFSDLINRSLIQIVETLEGRVSGCRIHDMVLDMIRNIAFEENFIALLGDNVEGTPTQSSVRRLAHHNRRAENKNSEATVAEGPKVRSYTTFLCCINNLDQFLRFKVLRVLDIVDCRFEKGCHLDHLGDLVHLRYLGIRNCKGIRLELPKQIGNLKLLQTIDVDPVLPETIVQLSKLLRLRGRLKDTQDGIGKLKSLQELTIIPIYYPMDRDVPKRLMKELGRLEELRVLKIETTQMDLDLDGSMQRDFVESLSNLKKIRHIDVDDISTYADIGIWDEVRFVLPESLCYLVLPFKFSKMPSCIDLSRLPCLSHLSLWVDHMDEHVLRLLAKLPELCYLCLGTESTVTLININAGDGGLFQKLRYFFTYSSMVQFEQPSEKDADVSLHLWNRKDDMPFVSRKSNDSTKAVVPPAVMPNLEVLEFDIHLQAIKDNNGDCAGSFGIEYLPSLRELRVNIDCDGVSFEVEVDAALAALGNACRVHPNHPTLDMQEV